MTEDNQFQKGNFRLYRLDNAANLYPAIRGERRPGVFRVSADLFELIQPELLQPALNDVLKRFPGFSVKLRAGLFWYYFIHSKEILTIQEDVSNPCMDIKIKENNGFLMRVRFYNYSIAVEFFHSLTDGAGAIIFLKTLLAQYLARCGHPIPRSQGVLDCNQAPTLDEFRDSFPEFAGKTTSRKRIIQRSYHVLGTPLPPRGLITITGIIPMKALKKESKKYGRSVTEFLVAIYIFILNKIQIFENPRHLMPIRIQVPVNLRGIYKTNTLRNFSAFVIPGIDPAHGEYTFEEILKSVHHFLHFEVTEKILRTQVAANLRSAMNPLIRIMPLFIKNPFINLIYKYIGPLSFTSTMSNIGVINVPKEMERHVKSFDITLGATQDTKISCGILGYKDHIHICFSRVIQESHVEKEFFKHLVRLGIPVTVVSNQE